MDQKGRRKILAADDEREIREVLKLLLEAQGYEVETAGDGKEALSLADETVDMYLLDVNMPGMNGFETARRLRERTQAPLLFLTAYSGEADKVMGFSLGADDYIVKPFSNLELIMRVQAIFRRMDRERGPRKETGEKNGTANKGIPIGDLFLDTESQSVVKGGSVVSLTYTEYRILELLARHPKKIFSLDHIYQSVWEEEAVGDASIMVHIKNIRKKLGDSSRNPRYIKTAWGKGYYID